MTIKHIIMAGLVCCGFTAALTSCSNKEEAFYTVSEDDAPRILNDDITADHEVYRNVNFKYDVLVTPAEMTKIEWFADGKLVWEDAHMNKKFEAGDYKLRIVATTVKGKQTHRDATLKVKPLDGDPGSNSTETTERIVKAGAPVKLTGENLENITKISIDGQKADATYNAAESCVEYTVPSGLKDGVYRISLVDNQDNSYGAGKVTVVNNPTILKSTFAGTSNSSLTIEGFSLDKVTSMSINGVDCPITTKSESSLTITIPELAVGEYEMKGTAEGGVALQFYNGTEFADKALFIVSEEEILWLGDFTVDWDGPEDHKEWRMISQEKFATLEIGHILKISLQMVGSDYHKAQFDNWSWSSLPIPNAVWEGSADTVVEIEITQELKDAVAAAAFCIHGHGISVVQASYQ